VGGADAYGWLKTESGVHRLARISPFDSNARTIRASRQYGYYPVVDDKMEVEINGAMEVQWVMTLGKSGGRSGLSAVVPQF
jgi:protein subunit release factor B